MKPGENIKKYLNARSKLLIYALFIIFSTISFVDLLLRRNFWNFNFFNVGNQMYTHTMSYNSCCTGAIYVTLCLLIDHAKFTLFENFDFDAVGEETSVSLSWAWPVRCNDDTHSNVIIRFAKLPSSTHTRTDAFLTRCHHGVPGMQIALGNYAYVKHMRRTVKTVSRDKIIEIIELIRSANRKLIKFQLPQRASKVKIHKNCI